MITHTLIVPKKASTVTFDLSGTHGKRCMRVEVYGKPVKEEGRQYFVKFSNKLCALRDSHGILSYFEHR